MKPTKVFLLTFVLMQGVQAQISIQYDAAGNRVSFDNQGAKPKLVATSTSAQLGQSITISMPSCKGTTGWSWSSSGSSSSVESTTRAGTITIKSSVASTITVQGTCIYSGGCKSPLSEPMVIKFSASGTRVGVTDSVQVVLNAEEDILEADFIVQPNPAQNQVIRLKTHLPENALFELYSLDGRQIPHKQIRNEPWVELTPCNSITTGMYIVTTLVEGKLVSQKVIVE